MPEALHLRECKKLIRDVKGKTYFPAILPIYEQILEELTIEQADTGLSGDAARKAATKLVLSRLHDLMRAAQPSVEQEISARARAGKIRNADQARKTAAGNLFQQILAYILAQNILIGNVSKPVAVTMSVQHLIEQYAAIRVGEDTLKPDSDIIIYSPNEENSPIMNFSCKTSCRERAGQTYKWKLMCDLATCDCDHRVGNPNCPATKYRLTYVPNRKILTCFVTTDFYHELANPQISAMFHFFDYSYVAKTVSPVGSVQTLENVIDDINRIF